MYIQNLLQKYFKNKAILAAASILLGIYMIIARRQALVNVVRIGGYALFAIAIVYVLAYFFGPSRDNGMLVYGCAALIGGLLVRGLASVIVNIFPIIAGILLIIAGVSNFIQSGSDVYPSYSKIGPVLTIVLGALIVFHPGSIMNLVVLLAGIALVLNGLSELDLIRRLW